MAAAPGNQYARKAKDWENALRRALDRYEGPGVTAGTALARIAERCVEQAVEGDIKAREEIANRLDGKPAQAVAVSGDGEGGAIKTVNEILIRAIDAACDRPAEESG